MYYLCIEFFMVLDFKVNWDWLSRWQSIFFALSGSSRQRHLQAEKCGLKEVDFLPLIFFEITSASFKGNALRQLRRHLTQFWLNLDTGPCKLFNTLRLYNKEWGTSLFPHEAIMKRFSATIILVLAALGAVRRQKRQLRSAVKMRQWPTPWWIRIL